MFNQKNKKKGNQRPLSEVAAVTDGFKGRQVRELLELLLDTGSARSQVSYL